jgi:hypothetical protein
MSIHLFLTSLGSLLAAAGWALRRWRLGSPRGLTRAYLRGLERGDLEVLRRGGGSHFARLAASLVDPAQGDEESHGPAMAYRGLPEDAPARRREQLEQRLARGLEQPPTAAVRLVLGVLGLSLALLLAATVVVLWEMIWFAESGGEPTDLEVLAVLLSSGFTEVALAFAGYNGFCALRYRAGCRRALARLLPAVTEATSRAATGPRPAIHHCRLEVLAGAPEGTVYELDRTAMTLGRMEENGIAIPHRSLSRHHCRFIYAGGGFSVVDLQSANGVQVNDREVDEVALHDGDIIELGNVRLRFVLGAPPTIEEPGGEKGQVRCPACQAENPEHHRFCLVCGGELPR